MPSDWPPDPATPAAYDDLAAPLIATLRACYDLHERAGVDGIPYDGLPTGEAEAATVPSLPLDDEYLQQGDEDKLTWIIGHAIRIGVEQGRRVARRDGARNLLEVDVAFGELRDDPAVADLDARTLAICEVEIRSRLRDGVDVAAYVAQLSGKPRPELSDETRARLRQTWDQT